MKLLRTMCSSCTGGGRSKVCSLRVHGPHRAFSANLSKSNTESPGVGGHRKSASSWANNRMGCQREIFFRGPAIPAGILEHGSRPAVSPQQRGESFQRLAARPRDTWTATERSPRIFFRTRVPRPRGASQNSTRSPGRPRGSATQIFASFEKLFLVRDASEKLPRNSGWGGWVGAR